MTTTSYYLETVTHDLREQVDANDWKYSLQDLYDYGADDFAETLNENYWADDDVTGNGAYGYFRSETDAKACVCEHMDEVLDALSEFCATFDETYAHHGWAGLDATARCAVFYQACQDVADEFADYLRDNFEQLVKDGIIEPNDTAEVVELNNCLVVS